MNKERLIALSLIILAAAASRLLPHAPNITPIAAMALFAGARFENRWLALTIPAFAMLISDAIIGFYSGMWAVYASFAIIVTIGFWLKTRQGVIPIAAAMLAGSTSFFVISNIGVWLSSGLYPPTGEGLVTCFIAAIPFFANSIVGDMFYAALLFGIFAMVEKTYPRFTLTS